MSTFSGIAGLIIITIAVWFRNEKWQDMLFVLGGALLLVYSIHLKNLIFSILQAIFIISAGVELIKLRIK